jgi:hypothetical protein
MNDERRFFCRLAEVGHVIAEEVRVRLVYGVAAEGRAERAAKAAGNVWERAVGRGPTIPAQFSFEETDESSAARLRLRFSVRVSSPAGPQAGLSDSTEIEVGPDGVLIDGELLEDPDDPEELANLLRLGFGLPAPGGRSGGAG